MTTMIKIKDHDIDLNNLISFYPDSRALDPDNVTKFNDYIVIIDKKEKETLIKCEDEKEKNELLSKLSEANDKFLIEKNRR